jgi:hypothetical protein
MNSQVKMKWVKALRSGKYKQGFGTMRDHNDNFCVLGVLCNIHAQEHPEIAKKETYKRSYLGSSGALPKQVQKWAGFQSDSPKIGTGLYSKTLIHLNDSRRMSFKELAAVIEFTL